MTARATRPGGAFLEVIVVMLVLACMAGAAGYLLLFQGDPSTAARLGASRSIAIPTPFPSILDEPGFYTVRPGESLFGIAVAHGLDPADLRYWNSDQYPSLVSNEQVMTGWVLTLSGPPRPTPEPTPDVTPPPVTAGGGADPGTGLVTLPGLTVDVWNAAEAYYAISGANPAELAASMTANVPSRCLELSAAAVACVGPLTTDIEPTYSGDPTSGACTMTGATISTTYEATLPQWTAPAAVPPELLSWWQTVLEHVRWHEEQHVRIFDDQFARLPAMLAGRSCDDVQSVYDQFQAQMYAAQEAFHAVDANWMPPVYSGPWDW